MAITTLNDLKQACLNDLARGDDLADVVADYITGRIAYYQRYFIYATPQTQFINTVVGQVMYVLPISIIGVKFVRLNYQSVWQFLVPEPYERLLHADVNIPPTQSVPTSWAPYDAMIRLFPAPDRVYQLELTADGRVPAPVDDSDSNFWTIEEGGAASMIRYATTGQIRLLRLRDLQGAQADMEMAENERLALCRETTEKVSTGQVQVRW